VRLAILDRLETIGFALAAEPSLPLTGGARQTRIRMTPTSFFIGLAVDPIHYTFETSSKKLVRLEGASPRRSAWATTWRISMRAWSTHSSPTPIAEGRPGKVRAARRLTT